MLKIEKNIDNFESYAKIAARKGVELFVTYECYLDGYYASGKGIDKNRLLEVSQELNSSIYLLRVRRIATENKMFVLFGFSWKVPNGIKNAALFIDNNGDDIGIYSKTHLQDHDLIYLKGEDLPVFQIRFGKIGIMICADRRWPEVARTLKLKGAELIVNPTYGMWGYENEWWMRTRAYENEIYIAFAHPHVSFICNPKGNLEAKLLSNISEVLIHDIDLSAIPYEMLPVRRTLYPKVKKAYSPNSCTQAFILESARFFQYKKLQNGRRINGAS